MAPRPKIAIVAGEVATPRALALFEPLRAAFDVTIFALDGDAMQKAAAASSLKMRLYENAPDMPGYLRGLEDELASFDAVVGVETSRLATFQAVRAARKHGLPLGVVVNEFQPYFYESYPNIRAIQYDICNKADIFWASSEQAAQALRLDRVPEASIRRLDPVVDVVRFRIDSARRKKFRSYVGIGDDDVVLLFRHELAAHNRPEATLEALRIAYRTSGLKEPRVKLIFAGQGPAAMDLKYLAFDMGLGRAVLFLHQEAEPFLTDLYAATDVIVMPRPQRTETHEDLPIGMLEAMAAGAVPLVGSGSVAAELAGAAGLVYAGDEAEHLAARLHAVLTDAAVMATLRGAGQARVAAQFCQDRPADGFIADVKRLVEERRVERMPRRIGAALLDSIQQELDRGEPRSALVRIEEALLVGTQIPEERASIYRMKGDAHYACCELEEATTAYAEALKCDDRSHAALRGLGFVSWQSHSNEEALIFLRKALALEPEDATTMYGIGLVYRRLDLGEEAIFWLEKCVTAAGTPASAILALAQACMQSAQMEVGARVLERVIDTIGDHKTLLMALGQLYLNLGRTEQGHALLARALAEGRDAS
jgi:glycosyltransferase involved in cell wall biosynthesis